LTVMEGERTEGDELIDDYVDCLMSLDTNARPGHSDGLILGASTVEGAVGGGTESDAMRDFASPEDPKEPAVGMTFESDEAAKAFYNEYARRLGFPFRVGRSRRSKGTEEVLVMKRFVCSREGMYKKKKQASPDEATRKRERMSMREGCNAMMEVVRESDHWVVSKLEKAHNHDLGACSANIGYLRTREVSPTWKLETVNDFYKKYFNTKTTLEVFLNQFNLSMASQYEAEARADMDAYLNKTTTKTASLIEKQAASTYTKAVFSKFQEEFTESLGFIIQKTEDGCVSKYSITKDEDPSETFYVTYNALNKMASCSCKYFEFSGILCRHILGVYIIVDPRTLPPDYFLKRWTRKARDDDALLEENNNHHDEDPSQSITSRYNVLCVDAIRCAEKGAGSEAVYKAAKDILQKAYQEIIACERNPGWGSQRDAININEDVTIDDAMNDQSMPDSGRKVTNLLGQFLDSSWSPV
ncbi:Protein FAR1-RELATED SEQUENCE 3, partial [Dichanthelium oligosanthes]